MGGFAWDPEDAELTRESLEEAHRLGLKVVVWSWPERLGRAFDPGLTGRMIDWGVDGIITDDPGRLDSMLAARGLLPERHCSADPDPTERTAGRPGVRGTDGAGWLWEARNPVMAGGGGRHGSCPPRGP